MKQYRVRVIFLTIGVLFWTCTGPARNHLDALPEKPRAIDSTGKTDSIPRVDAAGAAAALPAPATLEIDAWPGEWFVLLEKPSLYCSYGYELYTCPRLDSCRGVADTSVATRYHRVRCGKFSGRRLQVVETKPRGDEWLIAFFDTSAGIKLYATTSKGVYHEIAREDDLDAARKRWMGKTLFSARGFITAFENGKANGIKVRLQDPLRVTGVRFGLTPLPTKPIWLMVETSRGEKGSIPVYYSWTNVKKESRHGGNPWDDDIFEINPSTIFTADAFTWETINEHHVRIGMTRDQVRLSWGRPVEEKTIRNGDRKRECWVYPAQRLLFEQDELISIEGAGTK